MAHPTVCEVFAEPDAPIPAELADLPQRTVAPRRVDLDDAVAALRAPRLVVVAHHIRPDAYLAAVLSRLMIRERLDVEVAYVAPGRTPATGVYRLPHGNDAAQLAVTGSVSVLPLIRDDTATALVGVGRQRGIDKLLTGECYVDNHRLFDGRARGVVVEPTRAEPGLQARLIGGRASFLRPPRWHSGRAAQTGGIDVIVDRDGVTAPRGVGRSTFYRHHVDWKLVDHV